MEYSKIYEDLDSVSILLRRALYDEFKAWKTTIENGNPDDILRHTHKIEDMLNTTMSSWCFHYYNNGKLAGYEKGLAEGINRSEARL